MIHHLNPGAVTVLPSPPPQRRRVIVVGAGLTGLSAAFHLGEHALLLDRRSELEESHDHPVDFTLGAASRGALGREEPVPGRDPARVGDAQRTAVVTGGGPPPRAQPQGSALIHVTRWQPPTLTSPETTLPSPTVCMLAPLLRGEIRLDALVVRVNPAQRMLELDDGSRFVFDKLISTMPLTALACRVMHELPGRVRNDAALRYWLQDHDIEVADRSTRELFGELDEFIAGRRIADRILPALAEKFGRSGLARRQAVPLFRPRLVPRADA